MKLVDGCTLSSDVTGHERVRHEGDQRCRDCNALPGHFHHPGCDVERCPECEGQSITCGCDDPVVKHLRPPDGYEIDPAKWRSFIRQQRLIMGCDWLTWVVEGPFGGNVVGDAVADMARRLDEAYRRDCNYGGKAYADAIHRTGPSRGKGGSTASGTVDLPG